MANSSAEERLTQSHRELKEQRCIFAVSHAASSSAGITPHIEYPPSQIQSMSHGFS